MAIIIQEADIFTDEIGNKEDWILRLTVDGLFNIWHHVPLTVKPADFQAYVDAHYPEILERCKRIYADKFTSKINLVETHLRVITLEKDVESLKVEG